MTNLYIDNKLGKYGDSLAIDGDTITVNPFYKANLSMIYIKGPFIDAEEWPNL